MSNTAVTVVDAVMGTGKSVWCSLQLKETNKRAVVVLPRITELERYEQLLDGVEGVVSLSDKQQNSKKDRFTDALADAQIILITHALFETYLTPSAFDIIREGEWSLVMDEVITAFEPISIVSGTDIDGLITREVLVIEDSNSAVKRLTVNPKTKAWYMGLPAHQASYLQKELVKMATVKDLLMVSNGDATHGFYTFSLREERLNAFQDITVMTYPFKDTDLDYWLQIKGYQVEHMELTCKSRTHSLSDFDLEPHDGNYSGRDFAHLIDIVGVNIRGKSICYGEKPNHFSSAESRKLKSSSYKKKLGEVRSRLRSFFRNDRDKSRCIQPEDFMFTCLSECIPLWSDRNKKLSPKFIGQAAWVAYNERGINDHSHKHNLAFLYNVYPFTDVEQTVNAFGFKYNKDRYALYVLIQWIWRSAIRRGEKIRLFLPSVRMRRILEEWLK